MDHEAVYAFALDLFPLTDEVLAENIVLGDALQRTSLEALLRAANGEDASESLSTVRVLLSLARDLGYVSPEVVAFLVRELDRLLAHPSRGVEA
jgi:hypothetical protein